MKLKPAELKTRQEAEHRMIDGEVFKFKKLDIYYSKDLHRFMASNFVTCSVYDIPWEHVTEWQVEVPRTWEDDVREGKPVLCIVPSVVHDSFFKLEVDKIDSDSPFRYHTCLGWHTQATPITPDDPAIYKGEK